MYSQCSMMTTPMFLSLQMNIYLLWSTILRRAEFWMHKRLGLEYFLWAAAAAIILVRKLDRAASTLSLAWGDPIRDS